MKEIWKDVVGYEGRYLVSNLGRVKSISTHRHSEKILKPTMRKGYAHVGLYKDGAYKIMSIHRLVAIAFIPNPLNKPQVNHIDSNRSNNVVSNLEWCTAKENQIHAWKFGYQHKTHTTLGQTGYLCKNSKTVLQINPQTNEVIAEYGSIAEAGRINNYSVPAIHRVCRHKRPLSYGYLWRYKEEFSNS